MIAGGDDVDAEGKKLVADLARDTKATSRVFTVGNDKIEVEPFFQFGQVGFHGISPRTPDHISEKQHSHAKTSVDFQAEFSVTTQSRR